ncbi:hypothetical protein SNEBB_003416 [Seison nebaliae]|nr:hypothetical protein SNEBB_003416 [Seison nebaliae]
MVRANYDYSYGDNEEYEEQQPEIIVRSNQMQQRRITVNVGEKLGFRCRIYSDSQVNVQMYQIVKNATALALHGNIDQKKLIYDTQQDSDRKEENGHIISKSKAVLDRSNGRMRTIVGFRTPMAKVEDSGEYYCSVGEEEVDSLPITVRVLIAPASVQIEQRNQLQSDQFSLNISEAFEFSCVVRTIFPNDTFIKILLNDKDITTLFPYKSIEKLNNNAHEYLIIQSTFTDNKYDLIKNELTTDDLEYTNELKCLATTTGQKDDFENFIDQNMDEVNRLGLENDDDQQHNIMKLQKKAIVHINFNLPVQNIECTNGEAIHKLRGLAFKCEWNSLPLAESQWIIEIDGNSYQLPQHNNSFVNQIIKQNTNGKQENILTIQDDFFSSSVPCNVDFCDDMKFEVIRRKLVESSQRLQFIFGAFNKLGKKQSVLIKPSPEYMRRVRSSEKQNVHHTKTPVERQGNVNPNEAASCATAYRFLSTILPLLLIFW